MKYKKKEESKNIYDITPNNMNNFMMFFRKKSLSVNGDTPDLGLLSYTSGSYFVQWGSRSITG